MGQLIGRKGQLVVEKVQLFEMFCSQQAATLTKDSADINQQHRGMAGDSGRNRTLNLLIRSQLLLTYAISGQLIRKIKAFLEAESKFLNQLTFCLRLVKTATGMFLSRAVPNPSQTTFNYQL